MVNLDLLSFYSELNYMKRSDTYGQTNLSFGGSGARTTVDISHNLGYDPFFIMGCDLFNNGIIWSNNWVHEFTQSSAGSDRQPGFYYWCTDNVLTGCLWNGTGSNATSGSRTFYYGVYLDYA